ncbi:sacsin N-terminal ATP-binding-like domain-containing protein [Arthrobacter sp. NPDC058192]|uniref:sacsin N-terminal ATP-binding-like domain-containing protein n=1 Tax=Arthrobacter sp. NPDC058192 TaxID=3346372 RepID=UPI0036F04D49
MTTFEELSARRRGYVKAARDNGFEEGLRRLLADLYPDNAHFIYELLQNAEDAGAREVKFSLRTDGLKVEHDGPRLFDLENIKSITGIGQSTKANDATSIGKFGVGFKAVYAYTQTPVIHSGVHSFEIQDLFIPRRVPAETRDGWTTFWFPFDHADKPAERAVEEVESALRDISRTTLLFLNNIRSIACSMPSGDDRLLERHSLDEHVIAIESLHEEGLSYWYRIAQEVMIEGKGYRAAAAFALEAHGSKHKEPHGPKGYSVKPVDGQVFIYFPALKETSGLKFHVHAPFASTVARDSVRDVPENDKLIEGIAELITEALPRMRDNGLITDGLLNALPNKNDGLSKRYAVLRDRITKAFSTQPLTPIHGGGHAPARSLLRSERSLRSVLSINDVNTLRGLYEYVGDQLGEGWLAARDGRPGAFLNSLDAVDFSRDELAEALERVAAIYDDVALALDDLYDEDRDDLGSWSNWLSEKDDAWLRTFYIMLEELAPRAISSSPYFDDDDADYLYALRRAPLLRVQDGDGVGYVPGPESYLPIAPGLRIDGLLADGLAPFEGSDDSERLESLRAFYRRTGAKLWDAAAELNAKFKNYGDTSAAITEEHVNDLETLARLIEDNAVSPSTYSSSSIFVAIKPDGTRYWASPNKVFLDEPFASTGLTSLYESDRFFGIRPGRLDPGYIGVLPEIAVLTETLGVLDGLRITRAAVNSNPEFSSEWVERENHNKISIDWQIPHFNLIVSNGDETLLRELWKLVTNAPHPYADATYRSNGSSRKHVMQSQLLLKLTSQAWVLDRDGNLCRPQDLTAAELAEGLVAPAHSPLLERAGFGRNAALEAMRRKGDEARAKAYGFSSLDALLEAAEVYRDDPDAFREFREWQQAKKLESLPCAPTSQPDARAERAGELAAVAPARRHEMRTRSVYVQVPGHLSAAREYLSQHYTNDHQVMICQVCSSSMPFKIRGGYYFEAVQFVNDAKRDLPENRLALCPTCAAKYRHARDTPPEELRDDLLTQGVGHRGSITVGVQLAGEATTVRFVGKHAIDLQAALRATEGEPIDDDEWGQ